MEKKGNVGVVVLVIILMLVSMLGASAAMCVAYFLG